MLDNAFPSVKVKRITLMNSQVNSGLTVDVDFSMSIQTRFSNTTKGHIYGPKDFYDNIKVLVVQIKNSDNIITDSQRTASRLATDVLIKKKFNREDYNIYTIKNARVKKHSDTSEIHFSTPVNFETRSGNLNSLSYIFIPFMSVGDSTRYVFGKPAIEKVIVGGSVNTIATLLTKPSGEVYVGPVHKHKNTLMVGERHTSRSHSTLTEHKVYNSTVHDLRIFDSMKKAKLISNQAPLQQNNVYFSDFFISRDDENNCRFLFFLDFLKLLKITSDFPWLYNSPSATQTILGASRIDSIKVLRRRKPSTSTNSFSLPSPRQTMNSDGKIIASSRDEKGGGLTTRPLIETKGEDVRHLGNIKEIRMDINSTKNRAFSGADVEVSKIGRGIYQYGVEVTVNEASVSFLRAKRNELKLALRRIENYCKRAERRGIFNRRLKNFSPSFKKKVKRDRIYFAVEKYVEIANMMHRQDSVFRSTEKITTTLYNLVCPINGTPINIKKLLELMSELLIRMDNQLGISHRSSPTKNYTLEGEAPEILKNTQKVATYKKIKWFDSYFDASLPQSAGYYFIKPSTGAKDGHVVVTGNQYSSLINAQTNKLFEGALSLDITKNITLDLTRTQNTYLSPMQVGLRGDEVISLVDKGSQFYDIDKYNNILAEIIKFNAGDTTTQKKAKIDKGSSNHENLRNNLIDIFTSFGCTIENIPAFSSTRENGVSDTIASIVDRDPSSKMTPVESKIIARQQKEKTTEKIKTNPNNILNRLASNFFSEEDPSPKDYNVYDIRDERFNYSSNSDSLNALPNQVKALIALYSDSTVGIQKDQLAGDYRDHFGFLHMNFLNIMRVDVLTGFSGQDLAKASFSPLSATNLKDGLNLCRLVRYESNAKGLPAMKIDYPVFYEYFILDNRGQNRIINKSLSRESLSKKAKARTPQPVVNATKKLEDFKGMASMMTSAKNLQTNLYITPPPTTRPSPATRNLQPQQQANPTQSTRSEIRRSSQTTRQASTRQATSPTPSPGMGSQGGGY